MRFLVGLLFVTAALAGCTDTADVPEGDVYATFETNMGTFKARLYSEMAPATVANFVELAEDSFYDDTKFHRIIRGFMMQGGDPNSKDDDPSDDGRGGPGYAIDDEFHPDARHDKPGILSMANSGPNTGGSQFFVLFDEAPWLDGLFPDGTPKPCGQIDPSTGRPYSCHAVFGEVIEGMDVVRMIEAEASSDAPNGVPPKQTVVLESVTITGEAPDAPEPAPEPEPEPRDQDLGNGLAADLITPGVWTITNTTDHVLWWAHNGGDATAVNVSFEAPEGWTVEAGTASMDLAAGGTDEQSNGRYTYPDWDWSVATVTVPEGTTGSFDGAIVLNGERTIFRYEVVATDDPVSTPGDAVTTQYRGYFTATDEEFDAGEFPLTIGGGRAIAGFDLGLAGHAVHENVTLVLPPALAYGYHAGGRVADFSGQWLSFEIALQESS